MYDETTELILQDVRCFHDEQRGSIRPITLLVGENSTGKTTFLSCFNVLHRLFSRVWDLDQQLDFNQEPFSMGSFRNIVSSKRGPEKNINQFKLGLKISKNSSQYHSTYRLVTTFSEQRSQPIISSLLFQFSENVYFGFKRSERDDTIIEIPGTNVRVGIPFNLTLRFLDLLDVIRFEERRSRAFEDLEPIFDYLSEVLDQLQNSTSEANHDNWRFSEQLIPNLTELITVAPLRSKPKRTYDPVREVQSPEGEHIPMLMMRLEFMDKDGWTSLQDSLVKFGRESGMFSDIEVKRAGEQMSDPFQLQFKVRTGLPANIRDVGYGISQSLPILVEVLASEKKLNLNHKTHCTFLMQQPEVHLHPRAQAELASFLVESYKNCGNRFLIETHSDYIIDRFRIEVRRENLKAKDVSILYFEPKDSGVKLHNMSLDENGNLLGAPSSYRDFFAKETDRILGFLE